MFRTLTRGYHCKASVADSGLPFFRQVDKAVNVS